MTKLLSVILLLITFQAFAQQSYILQMDSISSKGIKSFVTKIQFSQNLC
jgi:hypothetical protein